MKRIKNDFTSRFCYDNPSLPFIECYKYNITYNLSNPGRKEWFNKSLKAVSYANPDREKDNLSDDYNDESYEQYSCSDELSDD